MVVTCCNMVLSEYRDGPPNSLNFIATLIDGCMGCVGFLVPDLLEILLECIVAHMAQNYIQHVLL